MNEQNEVTQDEQEQDSPETVALAREHGWRDPSEWKGEPPKNGFVSASEFLRRSEKVLPIALARAKKAEERASKLEARIEAMETDHRDTIKRIERMSSVALEQQREQIEAQYSSRIEAAAELGDKEAVRQARKDEREALKAIDDKLKDEPKKDDKPSTADHPDVMEWLADNPWINTDEEMKAVAVHRHMKLLKEKPGLTLKQNLAEVRKYMEKRYPEQFGAEETEDDEPPRRGSPVEGGSRMNGGGGRSMYAKLPADAKAQADKFIKEDGLFLEKGETPEKNLAQARERYAAQYFGGAQ